VKVNGKGPYTFIFDTGGLNLVTPKLAKELGLAVEGKLEGRGAGEGTMEGGFTRVSALELGGASLKNQLFMSLPLDALSNVEGVDEVGMVGFETFRRFVTRIDYGKQTITLIEPKSFDAKEAGTPVKIVFNGNTPEVDGSFDGIPGKFQIDTGSRGSLTLSKSFAETNKLLAKYAKGVEAVDGWGVGGPTRGHVARGGVLKIGDVQVDHPVTSMGLDKKGAFGDNNPLAGNIGAGILKQFAVTFDYEHNTMYLRRVPGEVADYGTFDRAGMWFNKDGEGFKIVDVTANSPAAKAGLKPGDIITLVDGVPATSIALYDLRKRLRNDPPGMAITFGVKRGKLTRAIPVILRDQI
jgi:membrane-associated protease RseP (regulator of RpoE activity)